MKRKLTRVKVILVTALIAAAPLLYFNQPTHSAPLTSRTLNRSEPNAGDVSEYQFQFTQSTLPLLGSIVFEICSNSPIIGDPCVPVSGFSSLGTTLIAESGETGFAYDGINSTNDRIVISRSPAQVATQANVSYTLDNITNPDTAYVTSYARITTHSSIDGTGAVIDSGGIAFVPSEDVSLDLFVPPYLSFCAGITITGLDCGTATGNRLDFGSLSNTATSFDTNELVVTTNAALGYSMTVSGPTMTSGNNSIPRLAAPTVSAVGSSQFGLNLRDNSSPDVGSNVSGLVTGGPRPDYNNVNLFKYQSGDTIASSTISDATTYTVSYIINVGASQEPGIYSTTLTYVTFASF